MRLLLLTGWILFLVAIGHVAAGFIAGFNQTPDDRGQGRARSHAQAPSAEHGEDGALRPGDAPQAHPAPEATASGAAQRRASCQMLSLGVYLTTDSDHAV